MHQLPGERSGGGEEVKHLVPLALALAGCTVIEETPPPVWKAPVVERWRLTERAYGEIPDEWTAVGDGQVPGAESALLFEPVFREDRVPSVRPSPCRYSPCFHKLRVRYDGPENLGVGASAEMELYLDGPRDVAHVIALEGSHGGVEIREVRSATRLAGEPGRYLVAPGTRARVVFTSRYAGRAGLRAAVLGEVGAPPTWTPEASIATER